MPGDETPEGAGLTRIDRIAKTALLTALVLFVVVVQQIVERDSMIVRLNDQRRRIATHYAATGKNLRALRKQFWEEHTRTSKSWARAEENAKAHAPIGQEKIMRDALANTKLAKIVDEALNESAVAAYASALNSDDESNFESAQRRIENAASRSLPGFVPLADILRKYRGKPAILLVQRKKLADIANTIEEKTTATQSIPSPFGSFDLNPRLALLFIALATVFMYIGFLGGVKRLLGDLRNPEALPTFAYALSPRRRVGSRLLGSLALHIAWVALIGYVAIECARREAFDSAMFLDWRLAGRIIADWRMVRGIVSVGVAAVIVIFVVMVMGARWKMSRFTSFRPSRRAMLATTGVVLIGAELAVLRWLSRRNERLRSSYFPESVAALDNEPGDFFVRHDYVRNTKTLTAHDKKLCALHLPRAENRGPALRTDPVHRGKEAQILERLAMQAGSDLERIAYLRQAIAYAPFSIHVYDRLIRVHGRLKQYDDIKRLMNSAIRRSKEALDAAIIEQRVHRGKRPWREPSGLVAQLTKAHDAFVQKRLYLQLVPEFAAQRRAMKKKKREMRAVMSRGD